MLAATCNPEDQTCNSGARCLGVALWLKMNEQYCLKSIIFISLGFNLQEELEIKFYTTAEVGVNALLSHHATSLC
jgi:hypothetical protein